MEKQDLTDKPPRRPDKRTHDITTEDEHAAKRLRTVVPLENDSNAQTDSIQDPHDSDGDHIDLILDEDDDDNIADTSTDTSTAQQNNEDDTKPRRCLPVPLPTIPSGSPTRQQSESNDSIDKPLSITGPRAYKHGSVPSIGAFTASYGDVSAASGIKTPARPARQMFEMVDIEEATSRPARPAPPTKSHRQAESKPKPDEPVLTPVLKPVVKPIVKPVATKPLKSAMKSSTIRKSLSAQPIVDSSDLFVKDSDFDDTSVSEQPKKQVQFQLPDTEGSLQGDSPESTGSPKPLATPKNIASRAMVARPSSTDRAKPAGSSTPKLGDQPASAFQSIIATMKFQAFPTIAEPVSKEQNSSALGSVTLDTSTSSEHDLAAAEDLRKQRVEQKNERNRRNREAEHGTGLKQLAGAAEGFLVVKKTDGADDTTVISQAPFALNSSGGVKAVKDKRHDRKLGRITAQDLLLSSLRNDGSNWEVLRDKQAQLTGKRPSTSTMRKRHAQVQKALQNAKVPSALQSAARDAVDGAEDEVNALVNQSLEIVQLQQDDDVNDTTAATPHLARSTVLPSIGLRPGSVGKHDTKETSAISRKKPAEARPEVVANQSTPERPRTSRKKAVEARLEATAEQSTPDRPTTGGKKPSWAMLEACFAGRLEDTEESESDVESQSSETSQDPEGYIHFEYQVQRRECTTLQANTASISIEDALWHDVDEPYLSLSSANAAASGSALLMQYGTTPIVDGHHSFTTKHDTDEDGAVQCQYESELGKVQTTVARRIKTFREKVSVPSKSGWLSRTVYHIKQRISKRAEDGLFEEGRLLEVRETFVDESISADLAWANSKAIDKFVETTYVARSANLNLRDVEMTQSKQQLREKLYTRVMERCSLRARAQLGDCLRYGLRKASCLVLGTDLRHRSSPKQLGSPISSRSKLTGCLAILSIV